MTWQEAQKRRNELRQRMEQLGLTRCDEETEQEMVFASLNVVLDQVEMVHKSSD